MKKLLGFFVMLIGFQQSIAAPSATYRVVPNRRAVVTAISTATELCGKRAATQVKGNFTNTALQSMGVSSVYMSGPMVYNSDLVANPPHDGNGDGKATVTQTGNCEVISDNAGAITVNTTYSESTSTQPCRNGE